jgi:hypothetical protein
MTDAGGTKHNLPWLLRLIWRELLLPVAVVVGLLLIAVALIEGEPLQQFLYAVF